MALVSNTLADGLASDPVETEAEAIANFVAAWDAYFAGASVLAVTPAAGSYDAGLTAMAGAMTGLSVGSAASIVAGITAFWNTISPLSPTIWILTPAVVVPPLTSPTGISTLAAALAAQFATNVASSSDLATAAAAIAGLIHAGGGIGGFAPVQTPPSPTTVSTPIL